MMSWREQQLSWFHEPVMIQQDHDLVEYMKSNNITQARIHGDVEFFSKHVTPVEHSSDFSIWIENDTTQLFDFALLVDRLNHEIQHNLLTNGVLYLAVNKFLCEPKQYDIALPEDYNDAIKQYLETTIQASLVTALLPKHIEGNKFNWVHPLTRFYFKK